MLQCLELNFFSVDQDLVKSSATLVNLLGVIKGCVMKGVLFQSSKAVGSHEIARSSNRSNDHRGFILPGEPQSRTPPPRLCGSAARPGE